ncbi:phospholipase C, phosphocholine-specific [Kribbella sp. NBC_01245]|uniref:phosphocholine-specific phospholipase C n=1 Tax=Kribbella sp. NBC_01245 TaxID=2903578 RepID=UPI002E2E0FF1|nr:phospholipase C, phosphocholine-specific [Kribbella sp. NBC_01245]
MKRRDLLRASAAVAGFSLLPINLRNALALPAPTGGGLEMIEHVVIFMQENRSFDHYYGSLRGVRGFSDPTAIGLSSGRSVFHQPTGNGSGYVLPYQVADQFMAGTPHGWGDSHAAWNNGRNDQWVPYKTVRTMTHLRRESLPFYYALADAFTLCDAYHCSEAGPTNPNRMYMFTGTIGYEPGTTNRAIGNDSWDNPTHTGYTWTTYAERLQQAGRSYRVYQEWDNYGDNSLEYFTTYMDVAKKALAYTGHAKLYSFYYAIEKATPADQQTMLANLAKGVATLTPEERTMYDGGLRRERPGQLASAFKADVDAGRLPAVSYVVAPEDQSEHPDWGPNTGAELVKRVLDAIAAKPEVWNKTLVLLNYDENDGFFDHLPAPAPPLSTNDGLSTAPITDEVTLNAPIGLGARVPMMVVSPWSRGGNVCSEVFDHTSVVRFLEQWTGIAEPNISPWRRAVCGDLTSALDLTTAVVTYPNLPTPVPTSGPWSTKPTPPNPQVFPLHEPGVRPARPLPYNLTVSSRVTQERFWIDFRNDGMAGAHFFVHATGARTDGPWRYTVEAGKTLTDYWIAGTPTGAYDLTVTGANGFLRRFAGNRITTGKANPEATLRYAPADNQVWVRFANQGSVACTFTARVNNRAGGPWTYTVQPGGSVEDFFNVGGTYGWYDVTLTTDGGFVRRFAGHVEKGAQSNSDPVMGSGALPSTVKSSADKEIQLSLGTSRTITGVRFTPRVAGQFELFLSNDGITWGSPVAVSNSQPLRCWPAKAQYVRVRASTGGQQPWAVTPLGW